MKNRPSAFRGQDPLAGRRLVLTRNPEQGGPLAGRLRRMGAVVIEVPTIRIVPPRRPSVLARAANACREGRYDWVVLTSVNGARSFLKALGKGGKRAAVRIAAVGEATALRVRDAGIRPSLVPSRFSSRELARAFKSAVPPKRRILLVQGNLAPAELARALRSAGHRVTRVEGYRTVPVRTLSPRAGRALVGAKIDGVLFASPSAVRNFVRLLKGDVRNEATGWPAFAIGPVTAAQARRSGFKTVVEAGEASSDGLVETVGRVLGARTTFRGP